MLLIDALRAGGWPEDELGNALAIISHEDPSGNPAQPSGYNAGGGEYSWGLFQINLMAHPQYTVEQVSDAVFNATVAYQLFLSAGRTYRDWVYSAQAEGLPPYGNTRHSISEFQGLANVDVGGGGGSTPPSNTQPTTPTVPTIAGQSILPIALGALGVFLLLDALTD